MERQFLYLAGAWSADYFFVGAWSADEKNRGRSAECWKPPDAMVHIDRRLEDLKTFHRIKHFLLMVMWSICFNLF